MVTPAFTPPDILGLVRREVAVWEKLGNPSLLSRFVLRNGTVRAGRPRPDGIRKEKDKECFANATRLSLYGLSSKYRYVEGLAACSLGFPILHAWCEDAAGNVIDPTWREPEKCSYMGVVITASELQYSMLKHEVYGVLETGVGFNMDFMLARDPELITILEEFRVRNRAGSTFTL